MTETAGFVGAQQFPSAIQTTISELLVRQARAVEDRVCVLLRARGVDPDDRSEGWESRARAALADLERVDSCDMSDPYRMTVTTEIRPRSDIAERI